MLTDSVVYALANGLYGLATNDGTIHWELPEIAQNGGMALSEDALWINSAGHLGKATASDDAG
ncbi:hypothetical protein [Haloarchaeobius sp. HRN-SO-5]|uniref:hypothetical protein n=1 Tax=Haloarchaeobius sp. HRN-SO-5 TaxID=3446118 RepID=UPI003EB92D71